MADWHSQHAPVYHRWDIVSCCPGPRAAQRLALTAVHTCGISASVLLKGVFTYYFCRTDSSEKYSYLLKFLNKNKITHKYFTELLYINSIMHLRLGNCTSGRGVQKEKTPVVADLHTQRISSLELEYLIFSTLKYHGTVNIKLLLSGCFMQTIVNPKFMKAHTKIHTNKFINNRDLTVYRFSTKITWGNLS